MHPSLEMHPPPEIHSHLELPGNVPESRTGVASKDAWQAFRAAKADSVRCEHVLLKDLVAVLQGHDGQYIRFDGRFQAYKLLDRSFEAPLRALAEEIAKLGALYRGLLTDLKCLRPECGLVSQGFKSGLEEELKSFMKIVALFEAMLGEGASAMTLKRALVWLYTPKRQLVLLSELAAMAKEAIGADLLNRVAAYRSHGCRAVREVTERLLACMSRPYLSCLGEWVFKGNLVDPYNELFIAKKSSELSSAQDCWARVFCTCVEKIPTVLSPEVAQKIIITGKTLNFLRLCDALPQDDADTLMEEEDGAALELQSFDTIEASLSGFYATACRRLGGLLFDRFNFMKHLCILKDYLLLGRADFAQSLLESVFDSLNRPATAIFRHNLVGALDSSVRSTSPLESDSIILNLDVRLHEPSAGQGARQLGWDIFSLDYRVPSPLDAILTADVMRDYTRLSQYVWLEKRVQYTVQNSWARLRPYHSAVQQLPDLGMDFKRLQMLHQEAILAMNQVVQFSTGCLGRSWGVFERVLSETTQADLDTYINLHSQYLVSIRNGLLTCYNQNLRSKMMAIFSAVLKIDRTCQYFAQYVNMLAEHQPVDGSHAAQLKMLNDLRGHIQSSARQLHLDVDEFMLALQKETLMMNGNPAMKAAADNLVLMLDFTGYHERRGGFDTAKYCAPSAAKSF